MEKKFDTVVFDLDGTLINTIEDLKDSVNYALKKHGFPERTTGEVLGFVGNGVARLVYLSLPEGTDEKTCADCLEDFKEYYRTHSMVKTAPYEGIPEMLESLKERGISVAVVTNKMQDAAEDIIRGFFGDTVGVVIGQVDGVAQKPQPDGVWLAIDRLGSSRDKTVYVGDSEVDCATARNAGLPIIGVTWGFRDRKVLEENKAEFIVSSPEEITGLILGD